MPHRDPEEARRYQAAYYVAHQERILVRKRAYHIANREHRILQASASRRRRRAAKRGSHTEAEWQDLIARYGYRYLCCSDIPEKLTRDHVQPLSRGGTDNIDNIQPLCQHCNDAKGTVWYDFRKNCTIVQLAQM